MRNFKATVLTLTCISTLCAPLDSFAGAPGSVVGGLADSSAVAGNSNVGKASSDAELTGQVNQAETTMFGHTRPLMPLQGRVQDLETKLFGHAESGSLGSRVGRISQTLGSDDVNGKTLKGEIHSNQAQLSSTMNALSDTSTMPPPAPSLRQSLYGSAFSNLPPSTSGNYSGTLNLGNKPVQTISAGAQSANGVPSAQAGTETASTNVQKKHGMTHAQSAVLGVGLSAVGLGALHCPICRMLRGF